MSRRLVPAVLCAAFASWRSAQGPPPPCRPPAPAAVELQPRAHRAHGDRGNRKLTVFRRGSGTVTSNPAGINCTASTCFDHEAGLEERTCLVSDCNDWPTATGLHADRLGWTERLLALVERLSGNGHLHRLPR